MLLDSFGTANVEPISGYTLCTLGIFSEENKQALAKPIGLVLEWQRM